MSVDTSGYVYVVSNPAMPGIVKIGITNRDDLQQRLRELYNTSVPFHFDCEYACKVDDCAAVEKALQIAFNPNRVNPQREFFTIKSEQVIAILKLLEKENVTPKVSEEINETIGLTEKSSAELYKKQRRPSLDFIEMGVPIGSQLTIEVNGVEHSATVISNRKVSHNGIEYFLTKLTKELLELDYAVQPTAYWYYNGKCLREYYNNTYNTSDEE